MCHDGIRNFKSSPIHRLQEARKGIKTSSNKPATSSCNPHSCTICGLVCKSLAGLKCHTRFKHPNWTSCWILIRRNRRESPSYIYIYIYIYIYVVFRISLTSKQQQCVSSVGNLHAEKADFEMRAVLMLAAEAWACRCGNESIVRRFFTRNLFVCGQPKSISDFLFSNESLFFSLSMRNFSSKHKLHLLGPPLHEIARFNIDESILKSCLFSFNFQIYFDINTEFSLMLQ